ncbi:MAG TPA: acetolactate synthase large subunit [Candidatus Lambdaproteobacteria bacterium]|jgi:acetolactate synthase-1/2/3 large subunit|uniref:Acetolactate synthase large subunit n=1 Tax=SAR324 cluster bacterium TaxID=2024889 RepID=A0A432GEV9_9DELT|nr:MAG: acetolactate synthase large subunit [SAR324 cluster bacterium]HBD28120.1 acetolactate synthase large subunit [Deltaproteobacteria bacterium]HHZ86524.1 acetolactate synthase large subunit [Candidatus Lambdaproteobacteria bacterium]RTZ82015.1 MAG: acetolactate synthase large subunit [SAR324 cluster bacterium]RTZ86109.1 MAG: acetolactate synthase large subunit [SAR324 cluster bacterium]
MKASDLFVKALEEEGVEYIFGIPGEENLDLLNSLKDSSIKLILTRHEQAAGFMAATYGRLTGKSGVALSTLGPGATNLVTAAAYSQLAAMPMVMITGQKPVKHSKQGKFQILDVVDMMRPLTKYTHSIVSGNNIPSSIREAFRISQEERPGAAHLELPEDVAGEEAESQPLPCSRARRPVAEGKAIKQAVEMIEKAKNPLLLIGAGSNRKMPARMLRAFVDKTQMPFISTQMGKGVLDERDPLFLGNAALSANDFLHRAIAKADLIINVGHDDIEKPPFFMEQDSFQVIHINFLTAEVDPVYFPQLEVIGDIANSIWQINERIMPQGSWDFSYSLKVKKAVDAHLLEGADDPRFPMLPQRFVADVREAMPSNGIIALDNGVYKIWFARNYKAHEANTVLLDNALATMGAGLPSAMGAHMVFPKRKVMAICGDGGFMMNAQELETAVRLKMNLICLILRDNSYGMIRWKQANLGFEDFGLEYGNPDFVKFAECHGANGYRVEKTEDFVPLLKKCNDTPGVHIVELPVDYSENDRILNHEIKERSKRI